MAVETTEPIRAVGRRKTSVARVHFKPGNGTWTVNGKSLEEYFPRPLHRKRIEEAIHVAEVDGQFDVIARVRGGGASGQADALRLAVARAVVAQDGEIRSALRRHGLLTRDPRKVERKKPGRPKARKRFQFSKR